MVLLEDCTYKNTEVYVPNITRGKVVKCYDGDTVTIATIIDNKGYRFSVRMLGYDCAEIRSKNEQEKKVAKWAKEYITSMIYDKVVNVVQNEGYDKYGSSLDHEAYNQILGVSKKQQEKVISLCEKYPITEFRIIFDISEEILNEAKVDMKKRAYKNQKLIEKISTEKSNDEKYLPFGHDFSEK